MTDTTAPRARTLHLLEEATQADERSLTEDLELAELDGWDSMGMVMLPINEPAWPSIRNALASATDSLTAKVSSSEIRVLNAGFVVASVSAPSIIGAEGLARGGYLAAGSGCEANFI